MPLLLYENTAFFTGFIFLLRFWKVEAIPDQEFQKPHEMVRCEVFNLFFANHVSYFFTQLSTMKLNKLCKYKTILLLPSILKTKSPNLFLLMSDMRVKVMLGSSSFIYCIPLHHKAV